MRFFFGLPRFGYLWAKSHQTWAFLRARASSTSTVSKLWNSLWKVRRGLLTPSQRHDVLAESYALATQSSIHSTYTALPFFARADKGGCAVGICSRTAPALATRSENIMCSVDADSRFEALTDP